jgi:hypothetical protein
MKKLLLIAALLLPGCSVLGIGEHLSDGLKDEKAKWLAQGIHNYTYELTLLCFCGFTDPVVVTVMNDAVTSVVVKSTGAPAPSNPMYRTIPGLYDYLIDAAGRADEMEVDYDRAAHLPTEARIDFVTQAIDDELTVRAVNLVRK